MNKLFKSYVDFTLKENRPAINNILFANILFIMYVTLIIAGSSIPLWIIIIVSMSIIMNVIDFIIKWKDVDKNKKN
jgi:hypothetical protein